MDMYDEFYAMVCPQCKENIVDEYEEKCGHCILADFESLFNIELAPEEVYF